MPKRVDPEERRTQIAQALWRVTVDRGLDDVSLRHVAAEAGMSPGLVQHWFRTKEQMLRFALDRVSDQFTTRLGERMAEAGETTPRLAVRTMLVEFLPLDEERRLEAHVAMAFGVRATVVPAIAEHLREGMDQMREYLAEQIRAAGRPGAPGHPEHAAVALVALVDGLASHTLTGQCTAEDALAALDDQLDTIFGPGGTETPG